MFHPLANAAFLYAGWLALSSIYRTLREVSR